MSFSVSTAEEPAGGTDIMADQDTLDLPEMELMEPSEAAEEPEPGEDLEILETTIDGGLTINNATQYWVDAAQIVAEGPGTTLPADGPQILIVHTHGSEAYTPDRYNQYDASDSYRTEDKDYNVVRVGDELASALEAQGLSVLHDREIYDYPSYTGSYNRSGAAVEAYLATVTWFTKRWRNWTARPHPSS